MHVSLACALKNLTNDTRRLLRDLRGITGLAALSVAGDEDTVDIQISPVFPQGVRCSEEPQSGQTERWGIDTSTQPTNANLGKRRKTNDTSRQTQPPVSRENRRPEAPTAAPSPLCLPQVLSLQTLWEAHGGARGVRLRGYRVRETRGRKERAALLKSWVLTTQCGLLRSELTPRESGC